MNHIYISIGEQLLRLYDGEEVLEEFVISSSKNGVGYAEGSYCTPMGRFEISEKIGNGAEIGTIFKSRKPVGRWNGEPSDDDMVLTRILRLHGLDADNSNSMNRYIYIHGTNQEELLGKPRSCGCIRMANTDVVRLFDCIDVQAPVVIGI